MARRGSIIALGAGLAALGTFAHSAIVAPRQLRIRRQVIALAGLPAAFDNYRILHVSDTHLGALGSGAEQLLQLVSLQVDLIVHTGDLIETWSSAEACAHLLGSLRATDGILCVLGNHDYRAFRPDDDPTDLVVRLEAHGVTVLVN